MNKRFYIDAFVWGFLLWLFGYVLGFIFFSFVPTVLIGWVIMPFGVGATLFVLLKKVKSTSPQSFFLIAVIWTLLAIVLDYFFLVQMLHPADGYYKLDVYLYYALTFALPFVVGASKLRE